MRACHLPWDYQNPYQSQLAYGLEEQGVEVLRGGRSTWILRYLRKLRRGDIVHFHWLDPYFERPSFLFSLIKAVLFVLQVRLLKLSGRKVFYTLHNLDSHELCHPRLEHWVVTQVVKSADAVLAHCTHARRALIDRFGIKASKVHVVPHANYIGSYPNDISKADAREKLGLSEDQDVLVFIGSMRRYKGVGDLIEAVKAIKSDNLRVVLAGKMREGEERDHILAEVGQDSRISIHEGFVEDDELQDYLNASDAVVLPFTKVLTSGSMILAMSFARPVIVPRVGCLAEVAEFGGAYFIENGGPPVNELRASIKAVLADKHAALEEGQAGYEYIKQWDAAKVGELISKRYAAV